MVYIVVAVDPGGSTKLYNIYNIGVVHGLYSKSSRPRGFN